MLKYLLAQSDFGALFKFVSPNFVTVLSPRELFRLAQSIRSGAKNPDLVQTAATERARILSPSDALPHSPEGILELFFRQILNSRVWSLDFRPEAFAKSIAGELEWTPAALIHEFSPGFMRGIRKLYIGFYTQQDAVFDVALAELGLTPARDALHAHFGTGDQSAVVFRLKDFQTTFGQVFASCARTRTHLSPEFAALGFSLLTLYQTLESSNQPQDVRSAFVRAVQKSTDLAAGAKAQP